MWIRYRDGQPFRHVVAVAGSGVRAVEAAEAYARVPRRVLGLDGATPAVAAGSFGAAARRPETVLT